MRSSSTATRACAHRTGRVQLSRAAARLDRAHANAGPALEALQVDSAIIDGRIRRLNPQGVSDFQLLQNSFAVGQRATRLLRFRSVVPEWSRSAFVATLGAQEALQALCAGAESSSCSDSAHTRGRAQHSGARQGAWLGRIVSKRASSSYHAGAARTGKVQVSLRQDS